MINECVSEAIVKDEDIDERIEINITKDGLTPAEILKDTDNLIANLRMSIAKETLQIKIYERLKQRVLLRILKPEPKG